MQCSHFPQLQPFCPPIVLQPFTLAISSLLYSLGALGVDGWAESAFLSAYCCQPRIRHVVAALRAAS